MVENKKTIMKGEIQYIIGSVILSFMFLFMSCAEKDDFSGTGEMVELRLSVGDIIDNGEGEDLDRRGNEPDR